MQQPILNHNSHHDTYYVHVCTATVLFTLYSYTLREPHLQLIARTHRKVVQPPRTRPTSAGNLPGRVCRVCIVTVCVVDTRGFNI